MSHLQNGNWKSLSAFENKSSKHPQIWSEPGPKKRYFWPQKFCSNLSNELYGSSISWAIDGIGTIFFKNLKYIEIYLVGKLKIQNHFAFWQIDVGFPSPSLFHLLQKRFMDQRLQRLFWGKAHIPEIWKIWIIITEK